MIPKKGQMTVHDLQNLKGKRQIIMTTAHDYWTARAAQDAGVDIVVTSGEDYEAMATKVKEVRKADKLFGLYIKIDYTLPPNTAYFQDKMDNFAKSVFCLNP